MAARLDWRICMRGLILFAAVLAGLSFTMDKGQCVQPLDPVPRHAGGGRLDRNGPDVVLFLGGSPAQMGRQHGALLRTTIRTMIEDYVRPNLDGDHGLRLLTAARMVRSVLPPDYRTELDACAVAANVDPDELLIAQSLGDLETAVIGVPNVLSHSCSSYVAFGPATADGSLQCGRNLDYFFGESIPRYASLVTYYTPEAGHGYRFAAVGLAGILGGWTLVNERGLIVANHLGGGIKSRLDALPTLVLTRQIAQHAATVDEAVEMLAKLPRMRGQIIWLAQEARASEGRAAKAVAVEYDAARIAVRGSEEGVLIVTNQNRAFTPPPQPHLTCGRYRTIQRLIREKMGKLVPSDTLMLSPDVANASTLHSVQFHPAEGAFRVWFRPGWKMQAECVRYEMP